MTHRPRYFRILRRFWANSLIREMTFRGHFLVNVASELIWIVLLLLFVEVIFRTTDEVRGWTQAQYLVLMGTHMLVGSLFEAMFFGNCWRISHLVRTGNLDFVLIKPASTQFLLSFQQMDYSALASVPLGIGLCAYGVMRQGVSVDAGTIGLFVLLIAAGVMILYSLLFVFSITSVWLIRQTGVDHLWFYATSLSRYPAEIYRQFAGGALYFGLVFVVPLLMVTNLPANVLVRTFEGWMVFHLLGVGLVLLGLSSMVCHYALRWYRSASS